MSASTTCRPAVAAHSAVTAGAGMRVLQAGGSAADAAVAMTLAACVVEPLVVSLLSGMHAIHVDARQRVMGVDGFVDIPATTTGGRTVETAVDFGGAQVTYTVGPATFGVPGLVAGCGSLHAQFGRLPWADVVAPAIDLAADGFALTPQSAALLEMIAPVMTLGVGASVFCVDGRLRQTGEQVVLPGIAGVLEQIAEEGAQGLYRGRLGAELAEFCGDAGALVSDTDLARFTAAAHRPPAVALDGGWVARSRRGLSPLTDQLDRHRDTHGHAALRLVQAQGAVPTKATGTTSLAASDEQGSSCAVTASLGLGTGDWFHGSQLNSMLGELDLQEGPPRPGSRMGSMMAPTALLAPDGQSSVLGSAGGSRIPSALLRVIDGVVGQRLDAHAAVDLPRIHRIGQTVHVEPGIDDGSVAAIEAGGFTVQRWDVRQHFFGGVSVTGHVGAEGDPRRGGLALVG